MQFIWSLVLSSLSRHVYIRQKSKGRLLPQPLERQWVLHANEYFILLAEGPLHKCFFNSQLIHNNTAGPVKSTEMKKCETIKPKFLGWWQGWKRFKRDHVLFRLWAFWPCSQCFPAHGAPLGREPAWPPWKLSCKPSLLLPFHRVVWHQNPTPGAPNVSLAYAWSHCYFLWLAPELSQGPHALAKSTQHHLYY